MKTTKTERRKIVETILPELADAFVTTVGKKTVEGRSLIGRQIVKDIGGNTILPGGQYTVDENKTVKINHRQRLDDIIDKAKDFDEMTGEIAKYLAKHSKNKPI